MSATERNWKFTPLAEIGTWYGGGTPSKSRPEFWHDGKVPWLSPKDMGPDVIVETRDRITERALASSATRRVPAGAVAIVVRSGILERKLPVAVVPFETTLNQDMKAVVPRQGLDARWVAWALRSRERSLLRRCRKAGTTVASIDTRRLLAEEIPVPRLSEQIAIVAKVEAMLSRLASAEVYLLAARRRVRALQATALEAVLPGLPNFESVSLGTLAVHSGYGTSAKCIAGGVGVPVVRIPNLIGGRIDLTDEKRVASATIDVASLMLQKNDVLFVRTNGSRELIGRTAVVQEAVSAAFASYLIRYRFDERRVRPRWVHLVMQTPSMRRQLEALAASSAGQHNLSLSKLDRVEIVLPPLAEQDELIRHVDGIVLNSSRLQDAVTAAMSRRDTLRRAVLEAATGAASEAW